MSPDEPTWGEPPPAPPPARETLKGLAILLPVFGGLLYITLGRHWSDFEEIRTQSLIWRTGTLAANVSVSGEEHASHLVEAFGLVSVFRYDLVVRYDDAQGKTHARPLLIESIGRSMDRRTTPVVRYDPNDPDEFALSWAVALGWARWGWTVFSWVVGVGVFMLTVLLISSAARRLRQARPSTGRPA